MELLDTGNDKTHIVKIWPIYFRQISSGEKTAEIRRADRRYMVGDILRMCEFDPETKLYTGWAISLGITCITSGMGIQEGFVMLSLGTVPANIGG